MYTTRFIVGSAWLATTVLALPLHAQFPALIDLLRTDPIFVVTGDGRYELAFLGDSAAGGGDFNADGIADFIVGAPGPYQSNSFWPPNVAYVFFGARHLSPEIGALDGANGFLVEGPGYLEMTGFSVANLADINGDLIDDLIVGAPGAGGYASGRAYILFGDPQLGGNGAFDLLTLDGSNGFRMDAENRYDFFGISVSGVGDINADGYNDLAVGAWWADPPGRPGAGRAYVVFGAPDVGAGGVLSPSSLNGQQGFTINGISPGDYLGLPVSGPGDVNDDGFDDILLLAPDALPNGAYRDGQAYVVFGGPDVGASGVFELADLDGTNGFRMDGLGVWGEGQLYVVGGVGDVNADGVPDFVVSASRMRYVIFGQAGLGRDGCFDLASLDGKNGFRVTFPYGDSIAVPASRVDINGDGVDDLVLGSSIDQSTRSGRVYVIYGHRDLGASGSFDAGTLDGQKGFLIHGPRWSRFGDAVAGVGDVNADGVEDLVIGSPYFSVLYRLSKVGRFDVLVGRRAPEPYHVDADPPADVSAPAEDPASGE